MSDSVLLRAEKVSKRYRIRPERSLALGFLKANRPSDHWALRDVDVELHEGEILAVVGRNGAGKSTLMKIAAGVTHATSGTLSRPERVAPLIEVGAGFHPELTGRENIEVNARLLGVRAREIRKVFTEIVEFAELAHAIDQPIRQYSSGMFMRLGFSVAVHTKPQLLIVDEVLAVGDVAFQVRCLDRIREMRSNGVGVLFVSHNLGAVLTLADRAMLLDSGHLEAEGSPSEVVGAFHQSMGASIEVGDVDQSGRLALDSVRVTDDTGVEPTLWAPGDRATLTLTLRAIGDNPEGIVGYRFMKDGVGMVARWIAEDGPYLPPMRAGECVDVALSLDLNFAEGGYTVDVAIGPKDRKEFTLNTESLYRFGISNRAGAIGIVDIAPTLEILDDR